jgi:hypothetical protein
MRFLSEPFMSQEVAVNCGSKISNLWQTCGEGFDRGKKCAKVFAVGAVRCRGGDLIEKIGSEQTI